MRQGLGLYVSSEEMRRLLTGLMLVVGGILLFALFAFLLVPALRNANRPAAEATLGVPAGETGWLDVTEYPKARGYEVPPLDPKTVLSPRPELLAQGKALFGRNCSSCHGTEGRGDGPAGAALSPAPRDLSRPAGWKNGPGLTAVFHTLKSGVPGSSMASYDFLSKLDRVALAHYVQTLGSFERPAEEPRALAALEADLAAPGGRMPNRIPVSAAVNRLVAEAPQVPAIELRHDAPAVLRRAIGDGARAARALAARPGWRADARVLALTTADAPANGFRVEVATFTAEEWRALAEALRVSLPEGD